MSAVAAPARGRTTVGDEGYFPEGHSILRRVHSERAVGLFYGQRALMIGALNPLAFVGTIEHTNAKMKPFQRLSHTAEVFETIFFGTATSAAIASARANTSLPVRTGIRPQPPAA